MQLLIYAVSFLLIALAAKKIGEWFSKIGLPYITGYLLTGMIAGPFVLNLMPSGSTTELRIIDELSLGIIAFVAGSELYLREIRHRIKSITWVTSSVVIVAAPLLGVALFVLTDFIPFTQGMTVSERLAVALLGGTILLALSPASTIAVIQEARAKGNFTSTILGITVTMDVVIIVLFAIVVAIASAMLTGVGFESTLLLLLLVDLGAAIILGLLIGKILDLILSTKIKKIGKIGLILAVGYVIFAFAYWLIDFSHDTLPFEIHVEPLLVAVISGFIITNFTKHREQFAELLHKVSPMVYVAFFTLTGVAIKLDILAQTWPIALALFAVRIVTIGIGSFAGGRLAGEDKSFNRYAWMGLITQAGIALGLAREVANEFPTLGDAFATMVISVVVLNEIFGPMLLKSALGRAGESRETDRTSDEKRDVVILGIEAQSVELARQLQRSNWQVVLADTDRQHVERLAAEDLTELHISAINEETIGRLINDNTDAVVVMLQNGADAVRAAELAYHARVPRLIVRPTDLSNVATFREMGALVIDPTSAMVNLLEESVRSPQTAAVLLHQDSGREMVQITVSNPDVDGMLVRDLRLPSDVLFLDVLRKGQSVVPNGYTRLNLSDELTLLGWADSLQEATLKLGY